ncbi:hypothetical protein EVAR_34758_1 [Eumeta japonica]|uniref:C3H1-type domain-containing protein n=1 Tax=Eumeta variegata TaxID=151549 RepID=A0A4C1YG96_EUMVA|nr:hypothetical protein EVAR_34758_1 [Eumeta japonica]
MSPMNVDSEREEGEIIDDLDDLSDISSEEEYLLRQRLEVLENYNNVLERKEAKKSSNQRDHQKTSKKCKNSNNNIIWSDVSSLTSTELGERTFSKDHKQRKDSKKPKALKHSIELNVKKRKPNFEICSEIVPVSKHKDHKKKHYKIKTKKKDTILLSDSSDETDYEYRNKRRRLANAVNVHGPKTDSSLTDRIKKMLSKPELRDQNVLPNIHAYINDVPILSDIVNQEVISKESTETNKKLKFENEKSDFCDKEIENEKEMNDLCVNIINEQVMKDVEVVNKDFIKATDFVDNKDFIKATDFVDNKDSVVDKPSLFKGVPEQDNSDEDLELLRQNALQTKLSKPQLVPPVINIQSEDEDSDTAELRVICLKSALLKKAIEMKQKQKLKKRLSQSSNIDDPLHSEIYQQNLEKCFSGNNTDIESVDMDIGISDGPDDDKRRDLTDNVTSLDNIKENNIKVADDNSNVMKPIEEEIDEDEDLLRAKLLISLSKTLPKLINDNITTKSFDVEGPVITSEPSNIPKENVSEEKRFIINTCDSDSGSDNEATKNLTKMHIKLSEQIDFQQKLDIFLKSTRLEVEKKSLPDLIQEPESIKTTRFIPKAVNHLPKSEQLEYNNLVKRMAELEKIKKSRQAAMTALNSKDTLKPRNVTIDTAIKNNTVQNLEEEIAVSRKKIADESAKVLRLKEEGVKLSQKFKIVATELRNIRTAQTINKREQRSANIILSKIRAQHQILLKRSKLVLRSKMNVHLNNISNNKLMVSRLQKENEPLKADIKNMQVLKSVKVNIVNDLHEEKPVSEGFSISVNVSNNKRLIKVPKDNSINDLENTGKEVMDSVNDEQLDRRVKNDVQHNTQNSPEVLSQAVRVEQMEKDNGKIVVSDLAKKNDTEDYQSPLQAFGSWHEDPYAVLCRFEVGGSCKDPDCKYLHPKPPTKH